MTKLKIYTHRDYRDGCLPPDVIVELRAVLTAVLKVQRAER